MALALADARANNYALGVKLVRGAYHPHEIAAHKAAVVYDKTTAIGNSAIATARPSLFISSDEEPPVWTEKRETDESYNSCLKVLILAVKDDVNRCEEAIRHTFMQGNTEVTRKNGWLGLFTSGRADNTDIKKNKTAGVDKKPKRATALPPPGIGVLFGTHNWNSCGLVLKNLVEAGLAVGNDDQELNPEAVSDIKIVITDEVVDRIVIAQLYGAFN